jgi:competence protein ComEA
MVIAVVPRSRLSTGRLRGGFGNSTFEGVREASNPEDVVRSRLRSVLAGTIPPAPSSVSPASPPRWPIGEDGPLAWSDLIPSWPDDVDLEEAPLVGPFRAGSGHTWQYEDEAGPPPLRPETPEPDDSAEVVRRVGLGAFDPGRRGVKALAAVAALVVLVAAFLAWRARPRVDPVPPVPSSATMAGGAAGGDGAAVRASPSGQVVIAVAGKVKSPGLVRLPAGSRVADALQAAGGAQPGVDVSLLNLARKVVDGELIMVGVTASPGAVVVPGAAAGASPGPVNLNTATLADLDTLPGVGPVLAQRIIDAREAQGGFTAVSDLRKVDGIGDSRYEQLKDLVTV